jgi:type VI secretion system protein ImpK
VSTTIIPQDAAVASVTPPTTVSELCAPALLLGMQLRAAREGGDVAVLRRRTRDLLTRIEGDLAQARVPRADQGHLTFALVAFLDESISQSEWSRKQEWLADPLQFEWFKRLDAGEEFFTRLAALLDDGSSSTTVLELFHVCLTLGFRGRYLLRPAAEVERLVGDVGTELRRRDGRTDVALAPHALPGEAIREHVRQIPAWVFGVCALGLVFAVYLAMTIAMSWRAADVRSLLP